MTGTMGWVSVEYDELLFYANLQEQKEMVVI